MLLDLIRFGHVIGIALGLGLAMFADGRFLRALSSPLDEEGLRQLRAIHGHVVTAMALLWITGLLLLWVRTGFRVEMFAPKLIWKVSIVSLLSANAMLIGTRVMPILEAAVGHSYVELRFWARMQISIIGGISAACWMSLLALGIFRDFKTMPHDEIAAILQWFFVLPVGGAMLIALTAPAFFEPRAPRYRTIPLHGQRTRWPYH